MREKRVNKSLIYIITMVLIIVLTISSIGLATWALLRTKLDIGGNVSFNGTGDVLATISDGKVNGTKPTGKMNGFTVDSTYSETNTNSKTWTGLDLEFDEEGTPIVLSFTVTNNHTTKTLLAETTSTFAGGAKMTMAVAAAGANADKIFIAPNTSKEYTITFTLNNTDDVVNPTAFTVALNMRNAKESEVEEFLLTDKFTFDLQSDYTYTVSAADRSKISGEITIPATFKGKSISTIKNGGFMGCGSLTRITLPTSINSIGHSAFSGCEKLTSITLPSNVTSIGGSAFAGCTSLTSITIPSAVTTLGNQAFRGCTGLKTVNIVDGLKVIESNAFWECGSLTTVTIPNSVTSIGDFAFWECTSLTSISFQKTSGTIDIEFGAFTGVPTTAKVNFNGATWTSESKRYTDSDAPAASELEEYRWTVTK